MPSGGIEVISSDVEQDVPRQEVAPSRRGAAWVSRLKGLAKVPARSRMPPRALGERLFFQHCGGLEGSVRGHGVGVGGGLQ
jgi:hypothetical protein